MTNAEKFKDKISEIGEKNCAVRNGRVCHCMDLYCGDCDVFAKHNGNISCDEMVKRWKEKEAEEEE